MDDQRNFSPDIYIYKRDYTKRMAVRLGSSDKMNEYKKLRNLVISKVRNS